MRRRITIEFDDEAELSDQETLKAFLNGDFDVQDLQLTDPGLTTLCETVSVKAELDDRLGRVIDPYRPFTKT